MHTCVWDNLEIGHFHNCWTSVALTVDKAMQHIIVSCISYTLYIPNFVEIGKSFLWRIGFITSTQRSQPKMYSDSLC